MSDRPNFLLPLGCLLAILYMTFCILTFQGSYQAETLGRERVTRELVAAKLTHTATRPAEYYRRLAERSQFYEHNPDDIPLLYRVAVRKSPADEKTFFSFAYYLASRSCCREQVWRLVEEAARRAPTDASLYLKSAALVLSLDDWDRAVPYIQQAIRLDPASSRTLFPLLEAHQIPLPAVVALTPDTPEAQYQMITYLTQRGDEGVRLARKTAEKLLNRKLDPGRRLQVARIAIQAGWHDLANQQAQEVLRSGESVEEAFRLLAETAFHERNWPEYKKYSGQAEQALLNIRGPDAAASFALESAVRLAEYDGPAGLKERLLQITTDYPRFAPAFARLALLSEQEPPEIQLYYWKKAVELDPKNIDYRRRLAALFISLSRPGEAESLFHSLLSLPETQIDAYVGLAQCKVLQGDTFQGIAVLQQGMERLGSQEPLLLQLGQLYNSIGDYERAARSFAEAARVGRNPVTSLNLAGDAYMTVRRAQEARHQYEQVLNHDPQNRHAREALQKLDSGNY